jgi:hypothetical protein
LSLAACSAPPYEPKDVRSPPNLADDAYPPRGWAWSRIPKQPRARRYGVASPPRAPKAEVLILPERAPAETWFPVVNALVEHGYNVWLADPLPSPLGQATAFDLRFDVIRKGSSDRLLILAEGRGAVAALGPSLGARGMVLWSPITGSAQAAVPVWELKAMVKVGLGRMGVLRPSYGDGGVRRGDALAEAWIKANPSLKPVRPTYAPLLDYEAERQSLAGPRSPGRRPDEPIWINGGDAAAKAACKRFDCKPIAAGVAPMIEVFDGLTRDATLGAPPPPVGKKRAAVKPRATAA